MASSDALKRALAETAQPHEAEAVLRRSLRLKVQLCGADSQQAADGRPPL